jgi:hypothetical protein
MTAASVSASRTDRPHGGMALSGRAPALRTLGTVFSTMLTKRRAVDHCRVRSSLCRMS